MRGIGFQQRWHKTLIFRRGQRQHGKTMLKLGEGSATLVGRHTGRDKIDEGEAKFFDGSAGNRQVAQMYGIESATQKRQFHASATGHVHWLFLFLKAARLGIRTL